MRQPVINGRPHLNQQTVQLR